MLQKSQTTTRDVNKKPVNSGINYLSLNWWQLGSPSLEKTRCSSGAHWGSFQVTSLRLSLERIKPGHFVCSQTGTFWDSIPYIPRKLADLCHDMLSMVFFLLPNYQHSFFLSKNEASMEERDPIRNLKLRKKDTFSSEPCRFCSALGGEISYIQHLSTPSTTQE